MINSNDINLDENADILPEEISMILDSNNDISHNIFSEGKNTSDIDIKKTHKPKKKSKGTKKTLKNKLSDIDMLQQDFNKLSSHTGATETFNFGDNVVYVKMREGTIVDKFDDGSGVIDYTLELKDDNCIISTTGTKYLVMSDDNDKKGGEIKYTKCLHGTIKEVLDNNMYNIQLSNHTDIQASSIDIMKPDDYNLLMQD